MVDLITNFLFPLLAGLTLVTIISRALTVWQARDRSAHTLAFFIVYVGLFVAFLTHSLDGDVVWLGVGYLIFALALLVGALVEWRDLLLWLQQKDKKFQAAEVVEETHTLEEVAGDNDLVLEAGVKDEAAEPAANGDEPR